MTDVHTPAQVVEIARSVLREFGVPYVAVQVSSATIGWTISVTGPDARLPLRVSTSPGKAAHVRETLRQAIEPLL